ncbi:uncharacterized protein LOC112528587 [Cynara cardunculus var. scolymus]|uniref:uncharacterized protein LOC112528587 n=1 Tax=Cynara cardunculus var. scolymus TaxID=59895 RepID=UPI000D628EFA|nr:uncharacterized protein LOC112528587 [Cynara cardunculus var. scolymus]
MILIADAVASLEESGESAGLGTPDSLLPPSEPPNIKNWFSSYEYESLVLETNDNFGFSDHQESQGYREESSVVENSREFIRGGENDGMMKKKSISSMLIKCNQSEEDNKCDNHCLNQVSDSPVLSPEAPGIDKWFSSYAYESPPLDDVILCDDEENTMECCNGKRKEGDDLICNQNLEGQRVKDSVTKESAIEIKVKDENVENGFVSVKRKREDVRTGKNELKRTASSSSPFVGNGIGKNKMKDERKTLADVTNIEISGKWKCPRKGKPEIGPPLKQLRLEQWFHHHHHHHHHV